MNFKPTDWKGQKISLPSARGANYGLNVALLELRNLKKGFFDPAGDRLQVVDISAFELAENQQTVLSGSSGSGKTTLLNLIAGILRPDAGEIRLAGEEITRLDEHQRDRFRAENIGYIFQIFNLLDGYSALENVLLGMAFGGKSDRSFAEHLLKRVGLADRMHYRPRQLSSGQQQRVAVARALANRPKLVLADEPTGNLDQKNSAAALALIREICAENKAALLLVSHDPSVIQSFEKRTELHQINRAVAMEDSK